MKSTKLVGQVRELDGQEGDGAHHLLRATAPANTGHDEGEIDVAGAAASRAATAPGAQHPRKVCPRGHILSVIRADDHTCDGCFRTLHHEAHAYGCRECNFDLCTSCASLDVDFENNPMVAFFSMRFCTAIAKFEGEKKASLVQKLATGEARLTGGAGQVRKTFAAPLPLLPSLLAQHTSFTMTSLTENHSHGCCCSRDDHAIRYHHVHSCCCCCCTCY